MIPQGQHIRLGGFLAFTVTIALVLKKLPVNKQPPNPNSLSKSLDYYKMMKNDIVTKLPNIVPPSDGKKSTSKTNNW